MSPDDPRPPYQQVADDLRASIKTGRYRPGQRLPSGRHLASEYAVAANTMQRAIDLLKAEGLLITYPTRGIFVRDPDRPDEHTEAEGATASNEYTELMEQLDRIEDHLTTIDRRLDALEARETQPDL